MSRRAAERGVRGWVANRPDGTVEAAFEGGSDAVEGMIRFAHKGPRGAEVERVEVFEEELEGLDRFSVR